ncbi:MAG: ParA family protein [Bradymonadaceae bacterium]|nr:ParA family protein [Lujinxingiaceae bacterium]
MRNLISTGLKRLVKQEARYARGDRQATVIAVATVKGGVGKTTTAVNIACGLARFSKKRVLLIDLDAQGHCHASLNAVMPPNASTRSALTLTDVLLGEERREVLDALVTARMERLDLTPADAGLAEAEGRISQKIGKELLLRDALKFTRTHYDYIIIDCPPNKGNLTLNALLAADKVLIPTDISPLSVRGADELLETVITVNERLHHELDVLGIVLTRVDGRNVSINEEILETIREAWGDLIFETHIGINTQIAKAQLAGLPLFDYAPESRGAKHYEALTHEIEARCR